MMTEQNKSDPRYKAVWLSFYSRDFYNRTYHNGKGWGLAYLSLLVLVCWILSLLAGAFYFCNFLDSEKASAIIKLLPDMKITNGKLSISKESPYLIKFQNPVSGEEKTIIFDTSGKTKDTDKADCVFKEEGLLLDGQNPVLWSMASFGKTVDLPQSGFKDFCRQICFYIVLAGLVLSPVACLAHIVLAFIYAPIAYVFPGLKERTFQKCTRMACVCMTPTIVLSTVFQLLYATPVLWSILTIPITFAYMFFAYNSVSREDSPPASNPN